MSLLMDALKKAEEAKRHNTGDSEMPVADRELRLEPASPLPKLEEHLAAVNADLAAQADTVPPPPVAPESSPEKRQAHNIFAAAGAPRTAPLRRRPLVWIVAAAGVVFILGAGVVGWQLSRPPATTLSTPPATTLPAPAQPNTTVDTTTPLPPAEAAVIPIAPATPDSSRPAGATILSEGASTTATARPPHSQTGVGLPPGEATPHRLRSPPQAHAPRQTVPPHREDHDTPLNRAYELLQAQRLDEAANAYRQVLRQDGRNPDALTGLAAIAAHQGDTGSAEALYGQALEADPRHAAALAGLVSLKGNSDPSGAESRLKTQLATDPDNAALHFALGNLMAGQRRWSEAQQAYFHAHTAEPDNPDAAFNLAVALDHLRQPRLAVQYYRVALLAAGQRPAGFDLEQARHRLEQLATPAKSRTP